MSKEEAKDLAPEEMYDVAISFLSEDNELAAKIYEELSPVLKVFIYFRRQEEVAGTNGLETFRAVFRYKSRLNVVLYRRRWGTTDWTAVESEAIQECALHKQWKGLLFIMLEECDPPAWLPENHIRLSYRLFGFEQTIGVIKARAQENGSLIHPHTPVDIARVIAERKRFEEERYRALNTNNYLQKFSKEIGSIFARVIELIEEINQTVPQFRIKLEQSRDNLCISLREDKGGATWRVNIYEQPLNPYTNQIPLLILYSTKQASPWTSCEPIEKIEFKLDYTREYGWCWRDSANKCILSDEIGNIAVKSLLRLIDKKG